MDSFLPRLVSAISQLVFELLFWSTAKVAIPVLTFGRWRVEPLNGSRPGIPWYGFKRQSDGTLLIGYLPAMFLGMTLWLAIGILLLARP